jgi:hypothetical protein
MSQITRFSRTVSLTMTPTKTMAKKNFKSSIKKFEPRACQDYEPLPVIPDLIRNPYSTSIQMPGQARHDNLLSNLNRAQEVRTPACRDYIEEFNNDNIIARYKKEKIRCFLTMSNLKKRYKILFKKLAKINIKY